MEKYSEQKALEAEAFAKEAKAHAAGALKCTLESYKRQRAIIGDPGRIAELDAEIAGLEETIRQMEE